MQFKTKICFAICFATGRKQPPTPGEPELPEKGAPTPLFFTVAPLVYEPLVLALALLNHPLD